MKLKLNISPCPNDTYMFGALVCGLIDTDGLEFETMFADIEELNNMALSGTPDVSKVSYALLPHIIGNYKVLTSGSALGRGNGPVLVAKGAVDINESSLRVAIPGKYTTANMLLEHIYPNLTDKTPLLFSEIADSVAAGEYDAGVLIHEGRFTYEKKGLIKLADLGEQWEQESGMPLPLGGIVVSRRLPADVQITVDLAVRRSVEYAFDHPDDVSSFVREHAQETDPAVIRSHIETFVNGYSIDLGDEGRCAVDSFTHMCGDDIFV